MNEPGNETWNNWQTLARQSWQAWSDLARSGAAGKPPPVAEDPASVTVQRMLDGLQSWQQWMHNAASTNLGGNDWQQNLAQMFQRGGQPFVQAFAGLDSSGAHGFEHMLQQWASMQPFNGAQAFNGMAQFNPLQQGSAGWREMLGMPTFGFSREQQQQQQQLSLAMLDYAEKMRAYNALIMRANLDGVQRMQARLAERGESDKPVESLRALYDLWVDVAEEAYAEIAMSDDFRHAYGDLVNAQMHMRLLQQKQVEQMCVQLGIPTHSEVESIGKRLQEVRRELRAGGTSALAEEVAALRAEVAALRNSATPAGRPATAKSATAPARKKAASKSASTPRRGKTARKTAAKANAPGKAPTSRKR